MSFARQIDEQRYREQTERQASMPGVTGHSFRCQKCKQNRRIGGRKQVVKGAQKFGYVCAECSAEHNGMQAGGAA